MLRTSSTTGITYESASLPKQIRTLIRDRSNGVCFYCTRSFDDTVLFTVDHKLQRYLGGSDDIDNLIAACKTCNAARGSRTVEEYKALKSLLS